MRTPGLVLVAFLVVSAFAVAVARPTYTVGDSWTYDVLGQTVKATVTTVGENVVVERNGWTNTTTPNPIPGQAPIVSSTLVKTTSTLRASDGAVVSVKTDTSTSTGGLQTGTNTQSTTITYEPPCLMTVFPLTVGSKWDVDCDYTVTTSIQTPGGTPQTGETKASYEVTARENVTVANGTMTFTAYKVVNMTGGSAGDASWFAPVVCATVKTADKAGKTTSELASYTCATPGVDDYTPPSPPPEEEEEPPANETPPEEETPPVDEEEPPATPPAEEDEGFLGMPAPGVLALVAGVAFLAMLRRR